MFILNPPVLVNVCPRFVLEDGTFSTPSYTSSLFVTISRNPVEDKSLAIIDGVVNTI